MSEANTGETKAKRAPRKVAGKTVEGTKGSANPPLDDLSSKVGMLDKFVFMDEPKKILEIAFSNEKNVILYGPGGYGKSELSLCYLDSKGINPYVITMGSGMTTDRLFGGLDIPAFNTTGRVEYLVENSFMNHQYVIFEELFDAPDYILEQLKDILSSGVFRNGSQIFEIKTKMIICCTNKTREEFSKNTSLKALMERFPLELKVVWKEHTKLNYEKLLNTQMGFANPMLTYILECFHKAGTTISPRIALTAAQIVEESGPDSLTFIADFAGKGDLLKTSISKFESIVVIQKKVKVLSDLEKKMFAVPLTAAGVKEGKDINKQIFAEVASLKAIKADDALASTTAQVIKKYTDLYETYKKKFDIAKAVDETIAAAMSDEDEGGF